MTRPSESQPGAVSRRRPRRPRTRPDGEVRRRWAWTEPTIWTDRMLTALEHGVQGGKLAQRLLHRAWAAFPGACPSLGPSILSEVTPPTGEPDAGDPHVRFGGRGDRTQSVLPTPIQELKSLRTHRGRARGSLARDSHAKRPVIRPATSGVIPTMGSLGSSRFAAPSDPEKEPNDESLGSFCAAKWLQIPHTL